MTNPFSRGSEARETRPASRVTRVRHELLRREVQVLSSGLLSPHLLSVTFGGESLAGFTSLSFDDHLKFMFQDARGEWVRRDYTPRRFDAASNELTLEFALHAHGPAADWARQARPGAQAVIGGPKGSMILPLDDDWQLLAGDLTALPAIARRLEELPARTRAVAIVQAEDEADWRDLPSAAQLQLQWVRTPDELLQALRRFERPAGSGFTWGGGEAALMAQARALLAHEKQVPGEDLRFSAYWKRGAADFHERLE